MRNIMFILLFAGLLYACNNPSKPTVATEPATVNPDSLPYTVARGKWQLGDPRYTKSILDMYKAWEENRLPDVAKLFDTVAVYETVSGRRILLTSATILDTLRSWRSYQTNISTEVVAAVTLHDPDRNEDWVSTWTRNRWTGPTGARDSSLANENWKFVHGKIVYSNAYEARPGTGQ